MNDFFSRLAARSLNLIPCLEPRRPSRFEPPGWEENRPAWGNGLETETLSPRIAPPPGDEPGREKPAANLPSPAGEGRESPLAPSPPPAPAPLPEMPGDSSRPEAGQTGKAEPGLRVREPLAPRAQPTSRGVVTASEEPAPHLTPRRRQAPATSIPEAEAPGEHPPPDRPLPQTPEQRETGVHVSPGSSAPPAGFGPPGPILWKEDAAEAGEPGPGRLIRPMAPPVPVPTEAPAAGGGEAATPATPPPPAISVTIGRIEIKAIPPAAAPPPGPRKRPAVMTLDDYLKQRQRGEKR